MKIYSAGPLFSDAERAFNADLARLLRGAGHLVFLPQEMEQRDMSPANIFQSDVGGVDWADVVLACMDGADPDSGTCWECGYAYGKGKPVITFKTDIRNTSGKDSPFNLMISQSSVVILGTGFDLYNNILEALK